MKISADAFFLIAGPCVIEGESHVMAMAASIAKIAAVHGFPCTFKASYDKANRTSLDSYRGVGLEAGLRLLEKVRSEMGLPVLSDVHSVAEVSAVAEVVDVIQIPALLCRQTDLLVAAAHTGKTINVKKGQFMAPWDMAHVVNKITSSGHASIWLTERGTSFGYNNLVSDMRSLVILRRFGCPVVFDGTHSVQLPGGGGHVSSGQREFVAPLSRAAVAAGCDGLFLEVHDTPDTAPSDGPNMINLPMLDMLLGQVRRLLNALQDL